MTPELLTSDLRGLGLNAGDVVLVHSSLSGLGWVDGGADTVIDALLNAVGDDGTILFPTLTGGKSNSPDDPPRIDLATTPAQDWVGIIPETARKHPGAKRSVHPTHSVTAIGASQDVWTRNHARGNSPCDESSPYFRLMENDGKILFLGGVTHESNTSLHCIEEITKVPYHLQPDVTDGIVVMPNGDRVVVRNRPHLWQNRYSHLGLTRDFSPVSEPLAAAGVQQAARIGESFSTLIDASGMRDVLLPLLESDPLFLLNRP